MRKLLVCLIFLATVFTAKAQFEMEGRVYYDSTQQQLKEVYHYYMRYSYKIDRATGDTTINPIPALIKHGACILYRKDGTIEATGQYKDGEKAGKWLFYDAKGKVVASEETY